MSDSPTTIRLTPALQRFLADRLQRDDRGARGPWTRTAILTTLAERYGYLLQSAGDLPAIPEATIRSCLGSLVLPVPVVSIPVLPAVFRQFDPAAGELLSRLPPLALVALIEHLERQARGRSPG